MSTELIQENTTRPVHCNVPLRYWKLSEALVVCTTVCRLFTPHDGPHKAYVEGIGWYAYDDKFVKHQEENVEPLP